MSNLEALSLTHEPIAQRRVRSRAQTERLPHPEIIESPGVIEQVPHAQRMRCGPGIVDWYIGQVLRDRSVELHAALRHESEYAGGEQRLGDGSHLHAVLSRHRAVACDVVVSGGADHGAARCH